MPTSLAVQHPAVPRSSHPRNHYGLQVPKRWSKALANRPYTAQGNHWVATPHQPLACNKLTKFCPADGSAVLGAPQPAFVPAASLAQAGISFFQQPLTIHTLQQASLQLPIPVKGSAALEVQAPAAVADQSGALPAAAALLAAVQHAIDEAAQIPQQFAEAQKAAVALAVGASSRGCECTMFLVLLFVTVAHVAIIDHDLSLLILQPTSVLSCRCLKQYLLANKQLIPTQRPVTLLTTTPIHRLLNLAVRLIIIIDVNTSIAC